MFEACVIGCGQIGFEVLKELANKFGHNSVCGVDISQDVVEDLNNYYGIPAFLPKSNAYPFPDAKVYIISLWTMDSIVETAKLLKDKNPDFILIESTIDPEEKFRLGLAFEEHYSKIVYFPHRFNPNDPEHHIFNQPRLIGAESKETLNKAFNWLVDRVGMDEDDLKQVHPDVAIIAKVVENAYRAMEIILAQELAKALYDFGYDFNEVRKACNSKWNIDIRECKDGVRGKCLPKDLKFFNEHFQNNMIFKLGEMLNKQYIDEHDSAH